MREIFKSKKSLLCILVALVMLIGIAAPACKKKPKEPKVAVRSISYTAPDSSIFMG